MAKDGPEARIVDRETGTVELEGGLVRPKILFFRTRLAGLCSSPVVCEESGGLGPGSEEAHRAALEVEQRASGAYDKSMGSCTNRPC